MGGPRTRGHIGMGRRVAARPSRRVADTPRATGEEVCPGRVGTVEHVGSEGKVLSFAAHEGHAGVGPSHPGRRLYRDGRRCNSCRGETVAGTDVDHETIRQGPVESGDDVTWSIHRFALDGEELGLVGPVEGDDGHGSAAGDRGDAHPHSLPDLPRPRPPLRR